MNRRRVRRVLTGITALFIVGILAISCSPSGKPEKAESGEKKHSQAPKAPDFTLKTLEGKELSLSSFQGKVVLLNFWATWCPPCRAEIPIFHAYYKKWKDKGFVIIGISMDKSAQIAATFMRELGITYPNLLGNNALAAQYRVQGLPTTYILDREGRVVQMYVGMPRESRLEQDLRQALGL